MFKNISLRKLQITNRALTVFLVFFLGFWLFFNAFNTIGGQQFSYTADSLIHGKLYFINQPDTWFDSVYYNGHFYWPLGIFPALLLVPFVLAFKVLEGTLFLQGFLQLPLVLGIFYLLVKLGKLYGFSKEDSRYLAFAFCAASPFLIIALVPWSWYFSHVVAVFFTLLALYEYKTRRNYLLIGIFMGFVFMTRYTAGITSLFFLLSILFLDGSPKKNVIKHVLQLSIPIILSGLFLLSINYIRFGNVFDNGYKMVNNAVLTKDERFELLNYGLFQVRNIPTNFYYYFIKTLDPVLINKVSYLRNTYLLRPPYIQISFPGTSFFVAAPIFLYLFSKRKLSKESILALIPILLTLLLLLCYFWPGWRQVGPRYTLDFLPLAMLVLYQSFKDTKLSTGARLLILFSSALNLYLTCIVIFLQVL